MDQSSGWAKLGGLFLLVHDGSTGRGIALYQTKGGVDDLHLFYFSLLVSEHGPWEYWESREAIMTLGIRWVPGFCQWWHGCNMGLDDDLGYGAQGKDQAAKKKVGPVYGMFCFGWNRLLRLLLTLTKSARDCATHSISIAYYTRAKTTLFFPPPRQFILPIPLIQVKRRDSGRRRCKSSHKRSSIFFFFFLLMVTPCKFVHFLVLILVASIFAFLGVFLTNTD